MSWLPFKRLWSHERDEVTGNKLPTRQTEDSAGFDLQAKEGGTLCPLDRVLVKTGFATAIPPGSVGFICPRSGLALKHGINVLNAPGVIDADYRGDVGVILQNHGDALFTWEAGDRIAQLVVVPLKAFAGAVEVNTLPETGRGAGGFGSTGE